MSMNEELRLSVSKVKCFDSCAKKFYYTYVLKAPRKEWDFYSFGKVLHKALEDFHLAYLQGSTAKYHTTMGQAFKTAKAEYKAQLTPEMIKECFQLLDQYLKILATKPEHPLSAPVTEAEKTFKISLSEQVSLVGAIDRAQIDADGVLHISDYKTTKNKKYLKDDFFQLQTYAMVMMMENPLLQKVRVSYILLRHNFEFLTQEFSRDDILPLKEKYLAYAEQIIAEDKYEANPSKMCRFCDFVDICPEGRKTLHISNGEVDW